MSRLCLLTPALRCGTLACAVLLGACAGLSGPALVQPDISGLLLHEGEPIADARVLLTRQQDDLACESPTAETTTDANGHFLIAAQQGKRFAIAWPSFATPQGLRLCFAAGDEFRSWLSTASADSVASQRLLLHCDLTRPAASSCRAQQH